LLFYSPLPAYTPHTEEHVQNLKENDALPRKSKRYRKISLRLSDLPHLVTTLVIGIMIGCWATTAYWNRQRALEREDHDRTTRQQHEELERKRSLIAWGELQASSVCTSYQTKEYTATLYNVPFGVDPIEECYNRTIEINGLQEDPVLCEDRVSAPAYLFHLTDRTRRLAF